MESQGRVGYELKHLNVRHGDKSAGRSTADINLGRRERIVGLSAGPIAFRYGERPSPRAFAYLTIPVLIICPSRLSLASFFVRSR